MPEPNLPAASEVTLGDAFLQGNYGICRGLDKRNNIGSWIVRLRRDGRRVGTRYFYDHHYPSVGDALEAAKRYRNELLLLYPPLSSRQHRQRLNQRNTSGVAGVSRDHGRTGYWIASTKLIDGTVILKRFSVKRHGEEQAKQLAIEERQRQLQQIEDYFKVHDEGAGEFFNRQNFRG